MNRYFLLRTWLIIVLVTANIAVIAVSLAWLYESRQHNEDTARTLTQTISTALDTNLTGNIQKIDIAVSAVVDELDRQLRTHKALDHAMTAELLTRYAHRLSEVDAIRVSDKTGVVMLGKGVQKSSNATWADRDFFKHFRDQNDTTLWVSKPIIGRVDPQYVISFSKRYEYPNGSFAGIVSASVPISHFSTELSKFDLGPKGTVILRDSDNGLIARIPAIPDQKAGKIGDSGVSKAFRDLVASGVQRSTYHITNSPDGFERILTFSRLENAKMTAIVGTAKDDYLAGWYKERLSVSILAGTFILFTGVMGVFLLRLINRQSEYVEQINAIFELSPDGFVSFDEKHRVKFCSPAFVRMTGLDSASVIGLDQKTFAQKLREQYIPGARFDGIDALISEDMSQSNLEPRRELFEMKFPIGNILEVGLRVSNAETVSKILYFRDVTREKELELMKSEFLSTAAHELRTPMASIYGFAEVLLSDEFDADTRHELLTIIHTQSELMSSILNELLDLARIEARRGKDFVLEELNMVDVVASTVAGFKIPDQRQPPESVLPVEAPIVNADRLKLQQAIRNLISNAYKYSPNGGSVTIRYHKDSVSIPPMMGIEVQDEGIGMTSEQVARVCERFYRADTSGKIPGTGLGMSIVKEIVEFQHGRVEIKSEISQGTRVTIWLPCSSADV